MSKTDSPSPDAQSEPKDVLVKTPDGYRWELTGDLVTYPIEVRSASGEPALIPFVMDAQVDQDLAFAMLDEQMPLGIAEAGRDAQRTPLPEQAAARKLGLRHFRGVVTDEKASFAQMKRWLEEEEPQLAARVVERGYNLVLPLDGNGPPRLTFEVKDYREFSFRLMLYDAAERMPARVDATLVMDKETAEDEKSYQSAQSILREGRYSRAVVSWDRHLKLFRQKVREIRGGFLIDGKPCERGNREQWGPRFPIFLQIWAVGRMMSRAALKKG